MQARSPKLPIDTVRKYIGVCFDGTAIISRSGYVSDGMGGGTATFGAVGTVSCLVASDGKARELVIGGQTQSIVPWTIDMPYTTDARATDRIASDGYTFEVIGTSAMKSNPTYLRATCVRLQS